MFETANWVLFHFDIKAVTVTLAPAMTCLTHAFSFPSKIRSRCQADCDWQPCEPGASPSFSIELLLIGERRRISIERPKHIMTHYRAIQFLADSIRRPLLQVELPMDHCKAFMEPGLRSCDAPHLVRQTLALEVDKCGSWCGTWQSSLFSDSHFKIGNVRMGCPFREG